ncbi:MAG: hypothetical protein IAG13_27565 [Deltaproteobacteria bacterium]|nr:hypothetical protein [Nannocystaceae bacterium]
MLNALLSAALLLVDPAPGDMLFVPVRLCVAEYADATWRIVDEGGRRQWLRTPAGGTVSSGGPAGDLLAANDVFGPARIQFLPKTVESSVPVVGTAGLGANGVVSSEADIERLAAACAEALEAQGNGGNELILVFVGDLFGELGVTDGIDVDLPGAPALCSEPRDFDGTSFPAFVLVDEPCRRREPGSSLPDHGPFDTRCQDPQGPLDYDVSDFGAYLGHEFGHALLLGHGDGIDQGPIIGPAPPTDGARPFDEYCDPDEPSGPAPGEPRASLMDAVYGRCRGLTELQIELARAAAAARPGTMILATGPGCGDCRVGTHSPAWAPLLGLLALMRRRTSPRRAAPRSLRSVQTCAGSSQTDLVTTSREATQVPASSKGCAEKH